MWPNPQETAGLVTFTEDLNGKLHFCAVIIKIFIFYLLIFIFIFCAVHFIMFLGLKLTLCTPSHRYSRKSQQIFLEFDENFEYYAKFL